MRNRAVFDVVVGSGLALSPSATGDCNPAHYLLIAVPLGAVGLGGLNGRVFAWIRERGGNGATDYEGANWLGEQPGTFGLVRRKLASRGLVVASGLRRLTASGWTATVWVTPENKVRQGGGES